MEIFRAIQTKLNSGQNANTIASSLIGEQATLEDEDQDYIEEIVDFCQNGLLIDKTTLHDRRSGEAVLNTSTGMSACMYYQKTGEEKEKKKQKACVMLALGLMVQGKNAIAIISYDLDEKGMITNINRDPVNLDPIDLVSTSKGAVEGKLTTLGQQIKTSQSQLTALLHVRQKKVEAKQTEVFNKPLGKGQPITVSMFDDTWDRSDAYYNDVPMRLAEDMQKSVETVEQYQAALHDINIASKIQHTQDFSQPITLSHSARGIVFSATATYTGSSYLARFLNFNGGGHGFSATAHKVAMSKVHITHDDGETLRALIQAEYDLQDILHHISDEWVKLSGLQQQWRTTNQELHSELRSAGLELISGDASGKITQGGILSMGDHKEAKCPFLYDDPLGFVNLYFIQDTDTASVLYFDPSLKKSEVPKDQQAIHFSPNTDLSFTVNISATVNDNNTVNLDIVNTKDAGKAVETWQALPKDTSTISNILNGNSEIAFGALYKPYVAGEGFLVVKAKYTSEILSLSDDLATTIPNEGLEQALPPYLVKNPILSVGEHRFGLKVDGKITISKGSHTTEELDDLSQQICDIFDGTVEQDAPIDKVKLSAEEVDAIRLRIQENNAEWCTIIFPVETSSMRSGSISADCEVSSTYNYKDNFTFSLDQITHGIEKDFAGQRSFLFQAKNLGGGIETFKDFTYENETHLGIWHPTQASMCLQFNHVPVNGEGSDPGYLQLADKDKLDTCVPTNQGLSLEAWVKPISAGQYENDKTKPIVYFNNGNAKQHYALSLRKDSGDKLNCVVNIDGKTLTSEDTIPFNKWHHLAFIYRRYWSVRLNKEVIQCGKDIALDFDDEYSIEVFVKPENTNCELLSKGNEYQLALNNGKVEWKVANRNVLAKNDCTVGTELTKITIFRTRHKPSQAKMDVLKKSEISGNKAQDKWYNKKGKDDKLDVDTLVGDMESKEGTLLNKLKQSSNDNDEYKAKSHQVENDDYFYTLVVRSGTSSQAWVTENAVSSDTIESPEELNLGSDSFVGAFLSVRLWNRILNDDEVKEYRISEDQSSLVSWWAFNEGLESNVVYDHAGTSHGRLPGHGSEWVESPDENVVKYELYIDGKPIDYEKAEDNSETDWGSKGQTDQFSIAGYAYQSGGARCYYGQIDEVRVWNRTRTLEQITDNCFGVLKGEREALIAYYKFEFQPGDNPSQPGIHDSGNNGMDLLVNGKVYAKPDDAGSEVVKQILSTAPISTEIPIIHQAMSKVVYDKASINSAYGAVEYGDIQKDEEGVINGVLKRAYSIIGANKEWRLTTGYKVGNLKSQWYSQVQYDPQVMGYIEGPPPIPQENMPDPKNLSFFDMYEMLQENYVSFEQVDEVQYTYDTSKEKGYQVAFESSSDIGADISTLIAPFGFGIELEAQVTAKANSDWQHNHKQSQSLNSGAGLNIDKTMSARAVCYETDKGEFKLGNMGFALVKSKTADVYLLRMEHNDQLVSIYYEPSKDIPEDNNIIPFPIDPLYTKQGCLDGKTGEHADTHYPNAQLAYGEYSYFKPKEAYILKKKIERKQKYLQTYYEDVFDEQQVSNHFQLAAGLTGGMQALGAIPMSGGVVTSLMNQTLGQVATNIAYRNMQLKDDLVKVVSTRNICNQYIWTLDGGLYQEETQTISMQQETYSGDNDLDLGGGAGYGLSIKAGAESTSSFLFKSSSNLSVTKSKTKDSTQTFNVNVGLQLPLQSSFEYGGLSKRTLIKSSVKPGTVDAYRFMSFYLEPSSKNFSKLFDEVIDQKWLAESPHPNAIALRQAMGKAEAKKPCWRIFHRVTFVSRILPEFKKKASGTLEEAMDQLGIVSNYMLIKSFEPYLTGIKHDDALRSKVDQVIAKKFPTLKKHEAAVKGYLSEYFDVMSLGTTDVNANVAALADAPTLKRLHLQAFRDKQKSAPVGPSASESVGSVGSSLQSIISDDGLTPIQDKLPKDSVDTAGIDDTVMNPLIGDLSVTQTTMSITSRSDRAALPEDWVSDFADMAMVNDGNLAVFVGQAAGELYYSNGGYDLQVSDTLSKAMQQAIGDTMPPTPQKIWISNDGAVLIVAASDGMYVSRNHGDLWQRVHRAGVDNVFYYAYSVSSSGAYAIGAANNGKLYILNQPNNEDFVEKSLPSGNAMAAAVSEFGNIMVAGNDQGLLYISHNQGKTWAHLTDSISGKKVKALGILNNDTIIAVMTSDKAQLGDEAVTEVFKVKINGTVEPMNRWENESGDICEVVVSKNHKALAIRATATATALQTSHLYCVDAVGHRAIRDLPEEITALAISDCGKLIAYGGYGYCAISNDNGRNWGNLTLPGRDCRVLSIAISSDRQKIIICGSSGKICTSDDGGRTFVSN